jgi:hypothetical protein
MFLKGISRQFDAATQKLYGGISSFFIFLIIIWMPCTSGVTLCGGFFAVLGGKCWEVFSKKHLDILNKAGKFVVLTGWHATLEQGKQRSREQEVA